MHFYIDKYKLKTLQISFPTKIQRGKLFIVEFHPQKQTLTAAFCPKQGASTHLCCPHPGLCQALGYTTAALSHSSTCCFTSPTAPFLLGRSRTPQSSVKECPTACGQHPAESTCRGEAVLLTAQSHPPPRAIPCLSSQLRCEAVIKITPQRILKVILHSAGTKASWPRAC